MKRLALALLAIGPAACTVGPDHRVPDIDVPAHYLHARDIATEGAPIDRWWTTLGDPALAALVDEALAANPDIATAEARVRQSRAERDATVGGAAPQVNANVSVTREATSKNGPSLVNVPPNISPRTVLDDYRAGFDASWELDVFGRTRRAIEGADARVGGAVEGRNDAWMRIAAEVARDVVDYRVARRRLAVATRTLAAWDLTAKLVGLQVDAGSAAPIDARRTESERLAARATLPPLEADARTKLLALAVLIGRAPDEVDRIAARLETSAADEQPIESAVPVGLPSDLARRRPDVRRAERDLAAATADVGVAVGDLYPRFSLVGTLGLESIRPGDFADRASRFWSIGPQLTLPIFNGGRLRSTIAAREAARDAALADYRKAVLQALADVETALLRDGREAQRVRDLDAAWAASDDARALARERYRAGETSLTEVLDAERQANRLDDERTQSRGQRMQDRVALYKALGGGWDASARTERITRGATPSPASASR